MGGVRYLMFVMSINFQTADEPPHRIHESAGDYEREYSEKDGSA